MWVQVLCPHFYYVLTPACVSACAVPSLLLRVDTCVCVCVCMCITLTRTSFQHLHMCVCMSCTLRPGSSATSKPVSVTASVQTETIPTPPSSAPAAASHCTGARTNVVGARALGSEKGGGLRGLNGGFEGSSKHSSTRICHLDELLRSSTAGIPEEGTGEEQWCVWMATLTRRLIVFVCLHVRECKHDFWMNCRGPLWQGYWKSWSVFGWPP
jgi:hypothetical protein